MMKEEYHPDLVLGLDVLIGDPDILKPGPDTKRKADRIYIPEGYIYRAEDFRKEQSTRGEACKELLTTLREITALTRSDPDAVFTLENGTRVQIMTEFPQLMPGKMAKDSSRAQAISIARHLKEHSHHVAIMTGNDLMSIVANRSDIDVAPVNPDVYTGRRKVALPFELCNYWYNKGFLPDELISGLNLDTPLVDNEYVEFIVEDVTTSKNPSKSDLESRNIQNWISLIGRYDHDRIIPLDIESRLRELNAPFVPRNPGQAMALDALLAPPEEVSIAILSGIFGSGKTFLTTSTGILQTERGLYDEVFVCPRDGALGKDISFLPGDIDAKIQPKMAPIFDNIKSFLKLRGDQLKLENGGKKFNDSSKNNLASKRTLLNKRVVETFNLYFECEALIYMHGRNIANAFITYDEFQDMERYQAKALLTRIGERSKIVISGDPNQRTNPYLNAHSNGLSYSASHLKGEPHTRIITFLRDEIERSNAVRSIADYL